MDLSKKFKEEDKAKLVEFLNMTAEHATFDLDTKEVIKYFRLLNFMQGTLLPKVEGHILELLEVTPPAKSRGRQKK